MCKFLRGRRFSFLLRIHTPRSEIAGPYGDSVSNFLMSCRLFSEQLHRFTFPTATYTGSSFSRLPPTPVIWLSYYNLHNGATCSLLVLLMCIFLVPNVQVSMSMFLCSLVIYMSFVRNAYSAPLPIFNWVICFLLLTCEWSRYKSLIRYDWQIFSLRMVLSL